MARYKHYIESDRNEADALAIADIREYLSSKQWQVVREMAELGNIDMVNLGLGIAGVSGYPFHAFCRKYCLEAYRTWMHGGDDAVRTDEDGFTIKNGN